MIISDGVGKSYKAKVTKEHMLYALAVAETIEHHTNLVNGGSYSVNFEQTPSGAGDYFFYLKNTSSRDLVLEGIWLRTSGNEAIDIYLNVVGTPVGGSSATPVNLNSGSGAVADVTCYSGNDITGLSSEYLAFRYYAEGGTRSVWYNFNQDIIIAESDVFALSAVNGGVELDVSLEFYFDYANEALIT